MTFLSKNMKKKLKNYKQRDNETHYGKIRYRTRKQQEQEAIKELREFNAKTTN